MAYLDSAAAAQRDRMAAFARMEPAPSMVTNPQLLAAVDLGSNSFRLIVGRVEETDAGSQIYP
ncbi:MAG: exopolyphosphatase, partial [Paraburkholderia sp.]|nr:exopolyphosphatase [Paraburkholderia sp.]